MNNVQVKDVFKTRTAVVYEQCTGPGRIQNPSAVVYEQCTGQGRMTAVVYEQCTGQGRIQNPYCCSV